MPPTQFVAIYYRQVDPAELVYFTDNRGLCETQADSLVTVGQELRPGKVNQAPGISSNFRRRVRRAGAIVSTLWRTTPTPPPLWPVRGSDWSIRARAMRRPLHP